MAVFTTMRPKQLSYWAKQHPTAARWLIAFNRVVLSFLVFYGGAWLADESLTDSQAIFIASAATYLIGYLLYPRRKLGEPKSEKFFRQKLCDGLLVASSCVFWLGAGNYIIQWQPTTPSHASPPVEVLQSAIAKDKSRIQFPSQNGKIFKKARQKRDGIFKKAKAWKQQFFQKLKSRVKSKVNIIKNAFRKLDGGTIALLVLASLAIITVLGYVTAIISCNLSCNGQEGAATVAAILGCFLTVGLVAWMWAAAIKKSKQKELFKMQYPAPHPSAEPVSPVTLSSVQIDHPDVRICFESGSRSEMKDVTIRLGNEILLENLLLGVEPQCINLSLKPGEPNTISVSGGNGSVKMVIEDGDLKKSLSLQVADGNASNIDLVLRGK